MILVGIRVLYREPANGLDIMYQPSFSYISLSKKSAKNSNYVVTSEDFPFLTRINLKYLN